MKLSDDVLEKQKFNFMLRDEPHDESDSGWSILSGYEDDDYLSDSENFQIVSIGVILNVDDSILDFIQQPPLCVYERNNEVRFYKKLKRSGFHSFLLFVLSMLTFYKARFYFCFINSSSKKKVLGYLSTI
ncbi:DUF2185 domain-containing protein [Priestia flexa]|nr:DUF2185 domain-containing protein [Priestia flexa]MCA1202054.1 DUF2185 domain-containing protein [Priestia flexa]